MLDTIGEVIDELSSPNDVVADLFAGSGSVSRYLSQSRTVISADIQEYSRVICSAILTPSNSIQPEEIVERCRSSSMHAALTASCAEVIQYEEEAISRAFQGLPLQLCEFLEEGSFIKSADENYRNCTGLLERALKASYQKLLELEGRREGSCTATLYYGGIYFSFKQTAAIDAILYEIENSDVQDRDTLLAALLSAVSSAVNTIGKQFAQPIQPRMANGQPKKGIAVKVKKDREIDIFEVFFENLQRYVELNCSGLPHQALCMDYSEALDQLPKDTRVVYADPPTHVIIIAGSITFLRHFALETHQPFLEPKSAEVGVSAEVFIGNSVISPHSASGHKLLKPSQHYSIKFRNWAQAWCYRIHPTLFVKASTRGL